MGLKQQIERIQKWACNKTKFDCYNCYYSVFDEWDCCPFAKVLEAAEDMEKEVQDNDTRRSD